MFELVIQNNETEYVLYSDKDVRLVELMRQRHCRSLAVGEAVIRETKTEGESK